MKSLLDSFSFYFLFPTYTAFALLFIFFNIPETFYFGLLCYFGIVTVSVLGCSRLLSLKLYLQQSYQKIKPESAQAFIVLAVCFLIILLSPLDIYQNGFKLRHPNTYAEFHGIGRYIRHITNLCWICIPITFLFVKNRSLKLILVTYAIIFPILIVDRNRLLLSCYALLLSFILTDCPFKTTQKKFFHKVLLILIPILFISIFAIVGHFRSGSGFWVPSSGSALKEGAFPLTLSFYYLPNLLQQVVLYMTTPIFNFATIVSHDFINPDFLLSQLSPFGREQFDVYPYAPVLVPRFNVGTEFYPFLLYGGLSLFGCAFYIFLLAFALAIMLFQRYPNIFTFLIFIKLSYGVLFMGFGPQFYMLLNLMFIILMFVLWFLSKVLKDLNTIISMRRYYIGVTE